MKVVKNMANRIKKLRIEHGLTQKELADKLQVNNSQISRYEKDLLEPNQECLTKMSNLFDCTIDYILGNGEVRGQQNNDEYKIVIEMAKDSNITPQKLQALIQALSKN